MITTGVIEQAGALRHSQPCTGGRGVLDAQGRRGHNGKEMIAIAIRGAGIVCTMLALKGPGGGGGGVMLL